MKIGIIGVGAYSVALASMLHKKCDNIWMWTESDDRYNKYLADKCIKDVIEGISLSSDIKMSRNKEEVIKGSDIVLIACATAFVHSTCVDIKDFIGTDTVVCIASKGIDNKTCSFLSDIARNDLECDDIAILSGPSFAIDMVSNNPIGMSLASTSNKAIRRIKKYLQNDRLKLRETKDLIGVQICGSVKNVIAIAAGILKGLGYPESTQSFLITESLHDIKSLIGSLGGNPKTILSFAGVGDLLLTCSSTKSRNFSFGVLVGEDKNFDIDSYISTNTVEGYHTLLSIHKLIKNKHIKIPIIDLIYKIIVKHEDPNLLVEFLINKK